MKIKPLFLFFLLFVISVNAQIYTPQGTIQGASTNDNVGIGTNAPTNKLDVIGNGRISTTLTVGVGSVVGNRFIQLTPTTDTSMPNIQGILAGTGPGSFTLQGLGGNVGIGSQTAPTGKLDIFTGSTGISTTIAALPTGMISFANNGSSTVPTIFSKSSNSIGFSIFTGTNDANVNPDMRFVAMEEDGTDFATLTSPAFRFSRFSTPLFEILRNGNVGIGTTSPIAKFHVVDTNGGIFFDGSNAAYNRFKSTAVAPGNPKPLLISAQLSGTTPDIYINTSGNLGLGTMNPTSKLTVAGNINSREVKVTVDAGADFVFENNYNLLSLNALDKYIRENKHLPEIASADEMKKEGINLSEMNIKLLQKIEELTLYTIEQQKNTEKLTKIIETLTKRLEVVEEK
ncbi:hypothetical protein [Flavobacterium soyae]|uniref:Peptidase S74 domain-containing protein n=1 Tax=Flavobacterium soyae TaxID=2903098 RepID=A0ABZ2UMY1_9FLAO